jgi:predicted porin
MSVSVEYLLFPLKYRDYGPSLPYEDSTVESFYVQASYRFDPRWEVMMRYDYGVADRDDRDGTKFSESTGGFFPAHYGFSKILTAGLRWDISSHWMVRLEYSYNQGTYILSERENPLMQNTQTYWNMVAAQLSFRF